MQCGVNHPSAEHEKFASAEVIERASHSQSQAEINKKFKCERLIISADISEDLRADFSADFSANLRKIGNICGGKSADHKHCLRQHKSAQSAHCCWIKSRRKFYGCPINQQRSTLFQPVHIKRIIALRERQNTQANSSGVVCVCG